MDKDEFVNAVKDILNHLSDPAYLENRNLIELFYHGNETTLVKRVQALREVFQQSINFLKPPEGTPANAPEWRCFKILSYRYLQLKEWHLIEDELGLSQRQVQRDLKKGIDALNSILWDQYTPPVVDGSEGSTSPTEEAEVYDFELIKEELKNWEISYEMINLSQILEQALQLNSTFQKPGRQKSINLDEVDASLNVMVDQVLTKQGLYKIFSIAVAGEDPLQVDLNTRRLNDFFYELSFTFNASQVDIAGNWKIAQLFFTIQGLSHNITEADDKVVITVMLPVKKQISCLVIDDVDSAQRLIERMLGSYGIQVFGTRYYPEALNILELARPDFILLDILIPKMDGWQILRKLKSNPETAGIPAIICSVLYDPVLAEAEGASACIRKPINRLELIKTLRDLRLINSTD